MRLSMRMLSAELLCQSMPPGQPSSAIIACDVSDADTEVLQHKSYSSSLANKQCPTCFSHLPLS